MTGLLSDIETGFLENKNEVSEEKKIIYNSLVLIQNSEFELAKNLLLYACEKFPTSTEITYWLALVYRELGDFENSIDVFLNFITPSTDSDKLFRFAETLYLYQKDKSAVEAFEMYFDRVSDDCRHLFDAFKFYGNIMVRLGDFDAAEEYYNKAFVLQPESDDLLVNYGTLEVQKENLSKALERFREALRSNRLNDKAWIGLAMVHRHLGDFDLAWGNLKEALTISSDNKTSQQLFINWSAEEGNWQRIQNFIENLLEEDAADQDQKFLLAKIYFQFRQYKKSRVLLEDLKNQGASCEDMDSILKCLEKAEEEL